MGKHISSGRNPQYLSGEKMPHKNQEISILTITIKKRKVHNSSTPQRIPRKERKDREQGTEKQNRKRSQKHTHTLNQHDEQYQSHTSSGTINCSMYSSDFSKTTSLLTSSTPCSEYRPVKSLTCVPRFFCKSGRNGKNKPCYYLAINDNTKR
jgi:hypothetical protein